MGSSLLPRVLLAGACAGLCLATAACTTSSAGTAGGVAPAAVPAAAGSPTSTAASGASTGASASTSAPMGPQYKNLPTDWKTFSSWDAKLVTMAGPKARVTDRHGGAEDPNEIDVDRDWAAPGSGELTFALTEDEHHAPTSIDCYANNYNPGNSGTVAAIRELFRQCASADFPGADTAAAEQWTLRNLTNFFEHQRTAPHARAGTAIKEFGDGRYVLGTGYLPADGLDVTIYIRGLEVR